MNWLDRFKSKMSDKLPELSEATEVLAPPTPPALPALVLPGQTILLTKGKWVTLQGRVGIVADLDSSGYATVHLTNNIGETVEYARTPAGNLKLARLAEIPLLRRPTNPARAAVLGYV